MEETVDKKSNMMLESLLGVHIILSPNGSNTFYQK